MRIRVRHETRYAFDAAPAFGLQRLRLTPGEVPTQRVVAWDVTLDGLGVEARFSDQNGNAVTLASVREGATALSMLVEGEVETLSHDGVVGSHRGPPLWLYLRETALTQAGDGIAALARGLDPRDIGSFHELSNVIRARMPWTVGATEATTVAEAALARGAGVCQDHAQVFVSACRRRGVPARYVSGYLLMNDREKQEASHAWAEAHLPGLGWVGFDVSNGYSPDGRYVRLAAGLDYRDAAPISGLLRYDGGAERGERLSVSLNVAQVASQSQSQQ